jgi:hypothetical protein
VFYHHLELSQHILTNHTQEQPSQWLRRRFNCWIEDSPALFKEVHAKTRGRDYDILLPRPFSRAEAYRARIVRDMPHYHHTSEREADEPPGYSKVD